MRFIGVDLHTTQVTVCYLTEKEESSIRKYQLCEIEKFVLNLRKTDEIAVEATCNTRWFVEQVNGFVGRVVLVNPRQFEVVKNSVKKTDKNDAINLARFLRADLLPEVRGKAEEAEKVQSLVNTRTRIGETEDESDQQNTRLICFKRTEVKENQFGIGKRVGESIARRVERDRANRIGNHN